MLKNTASFIVSALLLGNSAVYAESFSVVEYINVSKSSPISETVNEEVPVEKCSDVKEKVGGSIGEHGDIIGAVAGGALGGVLGNQVGKGKGKTAATVGGAVLGTIAGQKVGSAYSTPSSESYQIVRKCEVIKTIQSRQVISGYHNTAKFKGREISVESDQPMKQIPVTITYSY